LLLILKPKKDGWNMMDNQMKDIIQQDFFNILKSHWGQIQERLYVGTALRRIDRVKQIERNGNNFDIEFTN
jgi:hypothetical protein